MPVCLCDRVIVHIYVGVCACVRACVGAWVGGWVGGCVDCEAGPVLVEIRLGITMVDLGLLVTGSPWTQSFYLSATTASILAKNRLVTLPAQPPPSGYIAALIAVLGFGSNFIPAKKVDTGDGLYFQVSLGLKGWYGCVRCVQMRTVVGPPNRHAPPNNANTTITAITAITALMIPTPPPLPSPRPPPPPPSPLPLLPILHIFHVFLLHSGSCAVASGSRR